MVFLVEISSLDNAHWTTSLVYGCQVECQVDCTICFTAQKRNATYGLKDLSP